MPVYRGYQAEIYKDGIKVGYVRNISVDIDEGLETYGVIDSHNVAQILEGPLSVTGKFSKAWVDTNYLQLISADTLDEFDLKIEVAGSYYLTLKYCKLSKGSVHVPQDGFLTEDYEFIAKTFEVGQVIREQIINGGFETGDKTGWTGDAVIATSADSEVYPHSGSYMAKGYAWEDRYLEQTLQSPVPQGSVTSFDFWYAGAYYPCPAQGTIIRARIKYTDLTETVVSHETTQSEDKTWIKIDLKPSVESGKTISGIKIEIVDNNTGEGWRACIDDVSLKT